MKSESMNDEPSLMVLRNGKKVLFIDQRVSRSSKIDQAALIVHRLEGRLQIKTRMTVMN